MASFTLVLQAAPIDTSNAGSNVIIPAVANLQILIYRVIINASSPTEITFYTGTQALTGPISLVSNQNFILDLDRSEYFLPWFVNSINQPFIVYNSNSVQIGGIVHYSTNYPQNLENI